MTHRLSISKTAIVFFVGLTMVLWSVGLAALAPAAQAASLVGGDLIKASGAAVYYYATDGTRYVFPNEKAYSTWYSDFSGVKTITDEELAAIPLSGKNVVYRAGTYLIKITTDPKVYAVSPKGVLRWVETEAVATSLWGANWASMVQDLPDAFFSNYTIGSSIASAVYPEGALVTDGTNTYYINASGAKQNVTSDGISANRLMSKFAASTSNLSSYPDGDQISAVTESLADTSQGGGSLLSITPVAGGLTVSLASSSPASSTVVADSTSADGAQALMDMAHFNFAASSSGDAKVTGLKFTRTGISSSSDLYNVYLYMDGVRIAESLSIADKLVSFSASAGLFTVPAGTTKTIVAKADLANGTSSGKTLGLSVNAASDVTTTAAVSGTYPVAGANHATASVSDLGKFALTHISIPSRVDPGDLGREVWRFQLGSTDQNILVEKLRLTMVGTVASSDLQNLGLFDGGTQLGSTVASLASDNTVTFDWASSPLKIKKGENKTLVLRADIISGTNRTFYFSFQRQSDLMAKDENYGVYVKPNFTDAFAIIPASASSVTIATGQMTVTRNSEPNGKVALNATGITLASWSLKAYGEDVKISSMVVTPTIAAGRNLDNGRLYLDGVQVGSEQTLDNAATETFSFGNTFVVGAGKTVTLTIVADVKSDSAATTALAANDTIYFTPSVTSGNATGVTSLATVAVSFGASNTLTVASGAITAVKSSAMADGSSTIITGVNNEQNVLVGKFILGAGAGEGVEVNQIVLSDNDSTAWSTMFTSVFLVPGGADPKDSTKLLAPARTASTSASQTYSFDINPVIPIAKGSQYTFDMYASSLASTASSQGTDGLVTAPIKLNSISYYQTTSQTSSTLTDFDSATSGTQELSGQNLKFASAGTLTAAIDAGTPMQQYVVMGDTGITLAKFKLTASLAEDLKVTRLILTDTTTNTGGFVNYRVYQGSTLIGTVDALNTTVGGVAVTTGTGVADFNGVSITVPKGDSTVLTVKADANTYPDATAGVSHTISLQDNVLSTGTQAAIEYQGSAGSITQIPATDVTGYAATSYRTGLTVTLNANSDSGVQVPSTSDKVAVYNFTADEAYDVTLNTISFQVSGTALPASGANVYTLKDSDGNSLGTVTWTIGTTTTAIFGNDTALAETVARGTTNTYSIYVNSSSTAFQQGTTIYKNFELTLTSWGWRDGAVSSNIAPLSSETSQDQTKSNTLQY